MKKKFLLGLIGVMAAVLITVPVLATVSVPEPDSTPTIINVNAYENVLTLGDQLFVVAINIPYATPPTTPSSQAYLGRILDNSGNDVGDTPIVSYSDSGYNYNTFSIYFSTAIVPWNVAPVYTLNLCGSPTITWTGGTGIYPSVSMPSTSFIWRTSTSVALTQTFIYNDIISWANTLTSYWNTPLTSTSGSTPVLSTTGATYFAQVVPGLQQMSPQLFATGTSIPTYIQRTQNTSAAVAVTNTWPFDFSGIAQWLGFPAGDSVFRGLAAVALIIILATVLNTRVPLSGIPVSWAALIGMASIGWITPVLCAGICFMCAVLFGMIFLLGKPIA